MFSSVTDSRLHNDVFNVQTLNLDIAVSITWHLHNITKRECAVVPRN